MTGRPRYEEMLATLVSALVTCMINVSLACTGWPWSGVSRTPMLVGTSIAYLAFERSSILYKSSF